MRGALLTLLVLPALSDHLSGAHIENEFQLLQPQNIVSALDSNYSIAVSPTLIGDDDYVYISFSAVRPRSSDWIAAYAPVPANDSMLTQTVPVKYAKCTFDKNYIASGNGTLRFQLTAAYRSALAFYYFTGGTYTPVLVAAATEIVHFTSDALTSPLLPRVMPTGDPTSLRVMWGSLNATAPAVRVSGGH
jgi:hypothetical protein